MTTPLHSAPQQDALLPCPACDLLELQEREARKQLKEAGVDATLVEVTTVEFGITVLRQERDRLAAELAEALDMLSDCAWQFLMEDSKDPTLLHHSFMSTEERLCDFLVQHGRMEQVSRGTFRLLPTDNHKDTTK